MEAIHIITVSSSLVRVDRRGYSGTEHAAKRVNGELVTLCGRRADGTGWHECEGPLEPSEIGCSSCQRALVQGAS